MNAAALAGRRRLLQSSHRAAARAWQWRSITPAPALRTYSSSKPNEGEDDVRIANISEADINGARTYCTDLLRKYDTPSYTLLPFVPAPANSAYLSLRALNVSLALIGDSTSAPAVGQMRMQFWRDSVTHALSLMPPKEPVAILLSHASALLQAQTGSARGLSKTWLNRLITTREAQLPNPPIADLAALETYAENTYSTLLYLTLSSLPVASVAADHLASHIGKAQGIATVLRGLPLLAFPHAAPPNNARSNANAQLSNANAMAQLNSQPTQGTVTLPLDVMVKAGVRENDVLRLGAEAPGLRDAVFEVATRANDHLITAREMLKNLRAGEGEGHEFEYAADAEHQHQSQQGSKDVQDVERAFGVFMPAVSTQMWLDKLQKCDFDVFDAKLRRADWKLPWKAYWAYSRRTL